MITRLFIAVMMVTTMMFCSEFAMCEDEFNPLIDIPMTMIHATWEVFLEFVVAVFIVPIIIGFSIPLSIWVLIQAKNFFFRAEKSQ